MPRIVKLSFILLLCLHLSSFKLLAEQHSNSSESSGGGSENSDEIDAQERQRDTAEQFSNALGDPSGDTKTVDSLARFVSSEDKDFSDVEESLDDGETTIEDSLETINNLLKEENSKNLTDEQRAALEELQTKIGYYS